MANTAQILEVIRVQRLKFALFSVYKIPLIITLNQIILFMLVLLCNFNNFVNAQRD